MGGSRSFGGRGQVAPLLVVVVLAAGGAVLLLGRLGQAAVQRARARTAADAAALAGAVEGEAAARELAAANGARLVSFTVVGPEAEVTVVAGQARATARARREKPSCPLRSLTAAAAAAARGAVHSGGCGPP